MAGPWSSGFSSGFGAARLPAAQGRLAVDVYNAAGTYQGSLYNIVGASRTRRVNQIGTWSFQIPAVDTNRTLLVMGREVRVFRDGDGELWRGIIEDVDTSADAAGQYITTVSGRSLAAELAYENTYFGGAVYQGISQDTALSNLLSGSDWTATTPGGLATMASGFDAKTKWEAANYIALAANGYLRETSTVRELELKTTNATATGVKLTNVEYVDPSLPSTIGLIRGIKVQESGAIINRICPIGTSAGDRTFDLRASTRNSPYSISSITPTIPLVVKALGTGGDSLANLTYNYDVTNTSRFRYAMAVTGLSTSQSQDVWTTRGDSAVQEENLSQQVSTASGFWAIKMFDIWNPRTIGEARNIMWSTTPAQFLAFSAAIFSHVDSGMPMRPDRTSYSIASGTSATASVTHASNVNDLVYNVTFAYLSPAKPTITGDATWTALDVNTTPSTYYQVWHGVKAGAASVVATHTLSSAASQWVSISFSIVGRRVYYLEDSTSVTAYRRRSDTRTYSWLQSSDFPDAEDAANTLYDVAAADLQREKDPVTTYEIDVAYFPLSGWNVGDAIPTTYRGLVVNSLTSRSVWKDVNTNLIVMEATDSYNTDGAREWQMTLTTSLQFARSLGRTFGDLAASVKSLSAR